ncbi:MULTISPECIES: DoxX family protein [Ectothiorhodospira]|jgi:putative oxidoreductase|uniref:Putative oxidoreductase n=1 Tax=Ectothiorhodospira marina TaxID=1396821 RepID=A0A1H7J836_9GAMM|nr:MULTISPECIES: DoxX family protein [Ectothiorhodospira]MCG5515521.1 DoxX family protein [Ectothiorhodospira sp. 9100]MCG5518483.1 DoxX family protein [Ectothiorhodospira sp. 9905]SEK69345.1 putative oxidoreductase [Ectothiorhodospira marina]
MQLNLNELLFGGQTPTSMATDAGMTVLRVSAGLMMAFGHGLGKLPPSPGFVGMVEGLGFHSPELFAWMAGLAEGMGGLLLAAGLLTRASAVAILGSMLVAAFMAHGGDPLFATGGPSKELALLYAAVMVPFLIAGSGRYGVDSMFRRQDD